MLSLNWSMLPMRRWEAMRCTRESVIMADSGLVDAAIYFYVAGEAALLDDGAEAADLGEHRIDEVLAAEAGIDGHDEGHVNVLKDFFEGDQWRGGVEGHAYAFAFVADLLDGSVEVGAGLDVDDDNVGPGSGEVVDVALRLLDHEVGFDGDGAVGAYGREHYGA